MSELRSERVPPVADSDPYAAQLHAVLQAETAIAAEGLTGPRESLFQPAASARPQQQQGNSSDDLTRALEESARVATARRAADDDDERLRIAMALSRSTQDEAPAPTSAPRPADDDLLREATRASEQAFIEHRRGMLDEVLGVLRACSPMLAQFIDEHCQIFVEGVGPDTLEVEIFNDFRRTVDALLTDLLSDVGMGIDDVARTLQLAREQPTQRADAGSLVQHLLAVESFASFRRLSARPSPAPLRRPAAMPRARGRAAVRSPCDAARWPARPCARLSRGVPSRGVPSRGVRAWQ